MGRRSPAGGRTAPAARRPSTASDRRGRRAPGPGTSRGARARTTRASVPRDQLEDRARRAAGPSSRPASRPPPRPAGRPSSGAARAAARGGCRCPRPWSRSRGPSRHPSSRARSRRAVRRSSARPQSVPAVGEPPRRSLSVGARQRERAGGAARAGWRSRPSVIERHVSGPAWGRGGRAGRASSSATCAQPISWPAGAHADSGGGQEPQRQPALPLARLGEREARDPDVCASAGRDRRQRRSPPATASPSTDTSQVARSQDVSRNSARFSSVTRPSRAATIASPSLAARTGDARCRCSKAAGLGLASGNVIPHRQKSPSFGRSPKSPP